MITTLYYIIAYLIGLACIGSYAAAFTVRWPIKCHYIWQNEAHNWLNNPFKQAPQAFSPTYRSHCVHCNRSLRWKDLIPIASFILLRRRCRYCNEVISFRYPAIESLHVFLCLPLLWFSSDLLTLGLYSLIMSALIIAAIIDIEHQLIPDECSIMVLSCGLLLGIINSSLLGSVLGMLIGFYLIMVLRWCYAMLKKQEGIGLGDAKLIAALGAWLGASALPSLLLCASIGGILYTVVSKRTGSEPMAFGPSLILSAILVFYLSLWKNTQLLS